MVEEKKKGKTEEKIFRLRAPDKVRGTNWRERFYNEQVPVRDRIAEVRRPMNAQDLIRRGWTEVGAKEGKEEKKSVPKPEEKKESPKPEEEKKDKKKGEKKE